MLNHLQVTRQGLPESLVGYQWMWLTAHQSLYVCGYTRSQTMREGGIFSHRLRPCSRVNNKTMDQMKLKKKCFYGDIAPHVRFIAILAWSSHFPADQYATEPTRLRRLYAKHPVIPGRMYPRRFGVSFLQGWVHWGQIHQGSLSLTRFNFNPNMDR